MLRSVLIAFLIVCGHSSFSQVNYKDFKEQYQISCTRMDSLSVMRSLKLLDSLSQFDITEGRELYLYDFGMTKYVMYGKWKNEDDLKEALDYFEEGFSIRKSSDFAWNLTLYSDLGDCDKALDYLNQFLELRKVEGIEIDYEQVYYVQRRCCN